MSLSMNILLLGLSGLVVGGVPSVHLEIEPCHAMVLPGGNISILCRAGVPISYCRIKLPGFGYLNLNKATRYNRDYQYFGTGLENGHCGVTLSQITDRLNGQVSCEIGTVEEPSVSSNNMTLVVAKRPATPEMIVTSSLTQSNEFKEGETIQANCTIKDGRPPANITWFLGDEMISDRLSQVQTFETANGLYTVTQNLTRSLTWRDNERNLKCVAGHLAFGNKKNHATKQLMVRYAPREVETPTEQYDFVIGQSGKVIVEVLANPRPTFTWHIGNISLQEGEHDWANEYEAGHVEFMGNGKYRATLFINYASWEVLANECSLKASNSEGERSYRVVISTSSQPRVAEVKILPRYLQVSDDVDASFLCILKDEAGQPVPLAECGFRDYDEDTTWDFSQGPASTQHSNGSYYGDGLSSGQCGITYRAAYGYTILGCRVKPAAGGYWQYKAAMLYVTWLAPQQFTLQSLPVLALPGADVSFPGLAEHGLDFCGFQYPSAEGRVWVEFDSGPASNSTSSHRYLGSGLDHKQCGITLLNVQPETSGFVWGYVRSDTPFTSARDFIELMVAEAPTSRPQLALNSPSANFTAGDTLLATCLVKQSRPVATITWYLGERVVRQDELNEEPDTSEWHWDHEPRSITQHLSLSLAVTDDGQVLKCEAGHLAWPSRTRDSNTFVIRVAQ